MVQLGTIFLLCGTLKAELPYAKVYKVRDKNRRLGLGLMGVHEWLLRRGYKYEVTAEFHDWLAVYRDVSDLVAASTADAMGISRPVARRSIAPTGTIGMIAGTTTGIEPIYAVATKRRYLKHGSEWNYSYTIDSTAKFLMNSLGIKSDAIETAASLASDYERRIAFQADVQDYVDMAISSTVNLPSWGSKENNEDLVRPFTETVAKYAHRLRGLTCYPNGSRGGQPLNAVPYDEASGKEGIEYVETYFDICDITGKGGSCGV
jgi:ribonucleoside-diphosphate reductase alpha chain